MLGTHPMPMRPFWKERSRLGNWSANWKRISFKRAHWNAKEMIGRSKRKRKSQPAQTVMCHSSREESEYGIYKQQLEEKFNSKEPTGPVQNAEQVFFPLDEK